MPPVLRAPKILADRFQAPEPRSEACLNCATPLTGPFCSRCGQRDVPPYPSMRELVTDAFWELSGWDGRFTTTLRALVRAPGRLTTEFLEGRRARYISPLRLYLVASLVYFVVAAAAPDLGRRGDVSAGGIEIGVTKTTAAQRVTNASADAKAGEITDAERESALKDIERAPAVMRPVLRRAVSDPRGFQRGLLESMPRVLFALVPVFAAIVALFFRRRKYPEHLYFALHLHAFVFAALTLSALAKFTHVLPIAVVVSVAMSVWIAIYAVAALRAVYRESMARTLIKGVGIAFLYALAGGVAMCGLVYWTALFA